MFETGNICLVNILEHLMLLPSLVKSLFNLLVTFGHYLLKEEIAK